MGWRNSAQKETLSKLGFLRLNVSNAIDYEVYIETQGGSTPSNRVLHADALR